MPKKKTRIAIIYDFDKTLATTDMQNFSFIPNLGMEPGEFWQRTGVFAKSQNVEKILSYMYMMIECCKEKGIPLTRKYLNECGKDIVFFPGVKEWFGRINDYAKRKDMVVEHYLVTSGNKEIVSGCEIYKSFKKVFGCEFAYDPVSKVAIWPKNAINYTQKTQYLFRISKGALNISDDDAVNSKTLKRRIEYDNMIYIGDGITDVPCMEIIKNSNGYSIAIESADKEIAKRLANDKRVQFVCKPDYREDSRLDKVVKKIIDFIEDKSILKSYNKLK